MNPPCTESPRGCPGDTPKCGECLPLKVGHPYGPHDRDLVPETVTVKVGQRGAVQDAQVPVPRAILKQRARLNTMAYEAAREARRTETGD